MATPERRRWLVVLAAFVGGLVVLCGLAILAIPDIPSGADSDEALAVLMAVRESGAIPDHGGAGRTQSTSRRFLLVYGVEDRAEQDAIVRAATAARRLHSSKPVDVVFYAATLVKDRSGGFTYPGGARLIRRETCP